MFILDAMANLKYLYLMISMLSEHRQNSFSFFKLTFFVDYLQDSLE